MHVCTILLLYINEIENFRLQIISEATNATATETLITVHNECFQDLTIIAPRLTPATSTNYISF